jgi:hypothetical protein
VSDIADPPLSATGSVVSDQFRWISKTFFYDFFSSFRNRKVPNTHP